MGSGRCGGRAPRKPYEALRAYLEVSLQEDLDPERCHFRNGDLEPSACKGVREAVENGEPEDARCNGCPVRDYSICPEPDALSLSALRFGGRFDHPAHENYRGLLLPAMFPRLSPGKLDGFLARRETIWQVMDEHRERKRKEQERRMRAGTRSGEGFDAS